MDESIDSIGSIVSLDSEGERRVADLVKSYKYRTETGRDEYWGDLSKTGPRLDAYLASIGKVIDSPAEDNEKFEKTPEYLRPFIDDFYEKKHRPRREEKYDRLRISGVVYDATPPIKKFETYKKWILAQPGEFPPRATDVPLRPIREMVIHFSNVLAGEYQELKNEKNIEKLRLWIANNKKYILRHNVMYNQMQDIVEYYATDELMELAESQSMSYTTLLDIIWTLLDRCKSRFALGEESQLSEMSDDPEYKLELDEWHKWQPYYARGMVVHLENVKKKMIQIAQELRSTIEAQRLEKENLDAEVVELKRIITDLIIQVDSANAYIGFLKMHVPEGVQESEDAFKAEMIYRRDIAETSLGRLTSSFDEMLGAENRSKKEMLQKFLESEAQRTEEQAKAMSDIIETSININLIHEIRNAVIERIQSLTPNPVEIDEAVVEWMSTTEQVLKKREREVHSIFQRCKFLEQRREDLLIELETSEAEIEHLIRKRDQVADESAGPCNILPAFQSSPRTSKTPSKGSRIPVSKFLKRFKTPQSQIVPRSTSPSPIAMPGPSAIAMPGPSAIVMPGTSSIAMSGPSGVAMPGPSGYKTAAFQSGSTPRRSIMKQVKKRMSKTAKKARNILRTPTVPVTPETPGVRRADDASPEYYVEYPEKFQEITDTPPVISPPSRHPSPLSQTFVLTSPKRAEPVFVNIDVKPSNLIDTENGECFVCDIKLDLQPGGLLPQLPQANGSFSSYKSHRSPKSRLEMPGSPVIKGRYMGRRNIPPDVTPTSTRKYGLFTPKGVLKRGQLNIRRIPGKGPISELPWSPTYLPEDARSPVTSLAPPLRWSDRSVSWEKKYGSDYASSPSSSPVIKKPTHGYLSPDFLLSSSSFKDPDSDLFFSSPKIKKQRYRYQSPDFDRNSPSPVIQRSDYRYISTPRRTHLSESPVSERGYFYGKGSLHSSHLNEAHFLDSSDLDKTSFLDSSPLNEANILDSSHLNEANILDLSHHNEANFLDSSHLNEANFLDWP